MNDGLKNKLKNSKIEGDVNRSWIRGGVDSRVLYKNTEYSK